MDQAEAMYDGGGGNPDVEEGELEEGELSSDEGEEPQAQGPPTLTEEAESVRLDPTNDDEVTADSTEDASNADLEKTNIQQRLLEEAGQGVMPGTR